MVEGVCVGLVSSPPEIKNNGARNILMFRLKHLNQFKGDFKPSILNVVYYGDPSRFAKPLVEGDLVQVMGQISIKKVEDKSYLSMMARVIDTTLSKLVERPSPQNNQNPYPQYPNQSYPQPNPNQQGFKQPLNQHSSFEMDGFV